MSATGLFPPRVYRGSLRQNADRSADIAEREAGSFGKAVEGVWIGSAFNVARHCWTMGRHSSVRVLHRYSYVCRTKQGASPGQSHLEIG
jgi:hypothetical protein